MYMPSRVELLSKWFRKVCLPRFRLSRASIGGDGNHASVACDFNVIARGSWIIARALQPRVVAYTAEGFIVEGQFRDPTLEVDAGGDACWSALVFILSLFVVPGLTNVDGMRPPTLVWVVALGLLATAPWGAIIGSLVKSSGAALGLTFLPLMALVAISGIFYPIRALPVWVQWIAQMFPVYWIGLGLRSVFSPAAAALEPGGTFRPLATFLVLAAWAVVGLLLAPPILRRMARRTSGSEMEAGKQRSIRR
jgi:hypothetical protein